jgi:hypothetical protein
MLIEIYENDYLIVVLCVLCALCGNERERTEDCQ